MANQYYRLWNGDNIFETDEEFQQRLIPYDVVYSDLFAHREIKINVTKRIGDRTILECTYKGVTKNLIVFNIKNSGVAKVQARKRIQVYHDIESESDRTYALCAYNAGDKRLYVITDITIALRHAQKGISYSSFWIEYEILRKCYEKESCEWNDSKKNRDFFALSSLCAAHLSDEELWNHLFFVTSSNDRTEEVNLDDYPETEDFDGRYIETTKTSVVRDSDLRKLALERENYTCELCGTKTTFEGIDGKQYFEGHHLIMYNKEVQQRYQVSLDNLANIMCLCPKCHKEIHYAKDEIKIRDVQKLFNRHRELYEIYGIKTGTDFKEILNDYVKGVKDDE